jgi:acyl-CoA dehydrogenase
MLSGESCKSCLTVSLFSAVVKSGIGEMVNRMAYQAVQLHGGYGTMEEYCISRLFRDARSLFIFAGTTEIMKLIITRRLGLV